MNKKAILCLMLIPFFSLAGCNSKQKVSVDETDLKNHISTARHEKIMTRLRYNVASVTYWEDSYEESLDTTRVASYGEIARETGSAVSFIDGDILMTDGHQSLSTTEKGFTFSEDEDFVDYLFLHETFLGEVSITKRQGEVTEVERVEQNLGITSSSQFAYLGLGDELNALANNIDDFWYGQDGKLNFVHVNESYTHDRIQHNYFDDGFIGITHQKEVTRYYLEQIGDEYNYRLVKTMTDAFYETNYDEDGNNLNEMVKTGSIHTERVVHYDPKPSDLKVNVNTQELMMAFDHFDGTLTAYTLTDAVQAADFSLVHTSEAGRANLYHYYMILDLEKDQEIYFIFSGSYTRVTRTEVDGEYVSGIQTTAIPDYKGYVIGSDDMLVNANVALTDDHELVSLADQVVEIDLYVTMSMQEAFYSPTGSEIFMLAEVVDMTWNVIG